RRREALPEEHRSFGSRWPCLSPSARPDSPTTVTTPPADHPHRRVGDAPGGGPGHDPADAVGKAILISRIISTVHARKQENRIKKACRTRFDGIQATQRSAA